MGQISTYFNPRPKGGLASDTMVNPKNKPRMVENLKFWENKQKASQRSSRRAQLGLPFEPYTLLEVLVGDVTLKGKRNQLANFGQIRGSLSTPRILKVGVRIWQVGLFGELGQARRVVW
ncbi:hypothetical protein H5410_027074 [Solanum commersonii]|uniref:Uncharacterized protein n=1 Tax=Solanum commersonii TaxID=4109 RepID=A0A9J5Z3C9_SOLCO|nr:hypothetical protein H5410_027074 [Solanum commersonii]